MMKFLRLIFIIPLIISFCFVTRAYSAETDLDEDTLILAAALWGESKNDSAGMQVVANTIMNRKKYYEQQNGGQTVSIKSIVENTDQYASWKNGWDASSIIKQMAEYQGSDKAAWETCVNYAKQALNGTLADITDGAMSYYAKDDPTLPDWARTNPKITTIGNKLVIKEDSPGEIKGIISLAGAVSGSQESDSASSSTEQCSGVDTVSRDISADTNSGHGIISDDTMQNMSAMLNRIYNNLGRVFMLGQGLLCYSTKVAYSCFGLDVAGGSAACLVKTPEINFFICGLAIYLTAFLMSIAIGMYFIDISFKLGFALMYLPVAIALWPFAPTKSKLTDAFAIILHNSMLYAMMSVGITYAIILIYNGVLGDASNWTSFWEAIEKESSERLSENFALTSTRVLVILFSLIFGFKIIASSVNNFLDYYFSDGVTGGESPMHHLGTQLFGMTAGNFAVSSLKWGGDVVSTQTGKVVEKAGNVFVNASEGKYTDSAVKFIGSFAKRQSGDTRIDSGIIPDPGAPTATGGGAAGTVPTSGASPATDGGAAGTNQKSFIENVYDETRPDESTLGLNNVISKTSSAIGGGLKSTFGAITHPQATYRTFSQLASEGVSDENSPYQNGKIIITNTGKVLFRKITPSSLREGLSEDNNFVENSGLFALNAIKEGTKVARKTTGDTVGLFGKALRGIGKEMQNNYSKKGSDDWYSKMQDNEAIEAEKKRLEEAVERNDSDSYGEQS